MSILSDNMRVLRSRMEYSQQKTADTLKITRGRYVKYEDGSSEPPIDILVRISRFFKVSIDLLVTVDIRKYPLDNLMELPNNRTILPIAVDGKGENKIEIVPQKAQMGYLKGYTDPDYIESLQTISLPFLRNGKFRAFPADGDSMPPYNDGTFIVGKYLESKDQLKAGRTYLFITRNDGIVYKRYAKQNKSGTLVSSDNTFYEPYEISWSDVMEIWEFACSINTKEISPESVDYHTIKEMFLNLKKEIGSLKNQ
ncbi:MAG: XRE family transcriptional regulator [Chryseobacterium sp. 39-10]|nr:helix-turn-helix domain-containing protein [Chryseobacterium sp.]OJV48504.1 MAG: XRE family transcriptional regulator [Chryseobacterium sp. 39-10]